MSLQLLRAELTALANKKTAQSSQGFFKTGKGEYGEGDIFLGIRVPQQKVVANKYWQKISLKDLQGLVESKFHEERLTALFILRKKYEKTDQKEQIVEFYLKNKKTINNWDLVDSSAPYILGEYLLTKSKKEQKDLLLKLASSKSLWDRRISILTTFAFIKNEDFDLAILLAEKSLKDKEDLIQKAVGWMLREIGKHNLKTEEDFLKKHAKNMPRTALRYAIEKFTKKEREYYLSI